MDFSTLINIANEDNMSSKILFKNGYYPQSLFFAQQSIEKLIKFLGLSHKYITTKDLEKNIQHKTSRIVKKIIIKYALKRENIRKLDDLFNSISQKTLNVKNSAKFINFIKSNINEIINDPLPWPLPFDRNNLFQPENLRYLYKLNDHPSDEIEKYIKMMDEPEFKKWIDVIKEQYLLAFEQTCKSSVVLYYLTIVFENHSSSSRYPNTVDFMNPSTIYNDKNPIIIELPYFQNIIDQCITAFCNYDKIIKSKK